LIARLNQVLDTPDVQVQKPLVVVKKRGRPARSKNKTSLILNTWKDASVGSVVNQGTTRELARINN